MAIRLSDNISDGVIERAHPWSWWGRDRLCVTLDDGSVVKIAIKILPENLVKEDVKFGFFEKRNWENWTCIKIKEKEPGKGFRGILIDHTNACKHFSRKGIDKEYVKKSIEKIKAAPKRLFSDPTFKIKGISSQELREVKQYIFKNYSDWDKSENKHIIPKTSQLARAINFVDETAYLLLNRGKRGDNKPEGSTKTISDAISLDDGITHASASFEVGTPKPTIAREVEIMNVFKDDDRFVKVEHLIQYQKNNLPKTRIIMPKYECDIFTAIDNPEEYKLTSSDRLDIAYQMIDIVQTVHKKGWLLRDIKLENFLLKKENGRWKVVCSDLEMFCEEAGDEIKKDIGTEIFLSPEFVLAEDEDRKATKERDMWALGMALADLFNVYTGEIHQLHNRIATFSSVRAPLNLLNESWLRCPTTPIEFLVYNMLQVDPNKRTLSGKAFDQITSIKKKEKTISFAFSRMRNGLFSLF